MEGGSERLLVIGGRQSPVAHRVQEWELRYEEAMVVEVDPSTGEARTRVEYQSRPEAQPEGGGPVLFKAGFIHGDELVVPTQTEVVTFSLPDFRQTGYLSLPCFNDVHHVRRTPEGTLLVVCTGLDMVVEVNPEGEVLQRWNVLGKDPWERFSPDEDYRRVPTTKPHDSHPNFVFYLDDEPWVTRFEQRDAVRLLRPEEPGFAIGVQRPHDGNVHEGEVFFTTVDGHVVVGDARSKEIARVHSLNQVRETRRPLGWCRGLHVVDRHRAVVGFSRLRPTNIAANVAWAKSMVRTMRSIAQLPTRVALFDFEAGRVEWEYDLEDLGLSVIFSILPYRPDDRS